MFISIFSFEIGNDFKTSTTLWEFLHKYERSDRKMEDGEAPKDTTTNNETMGIESPLTHRKKDLQSYFLHLSHDNSIVC